MEGRAPDADHQRPDLADVEEQLLEQADEAADAGHGARRDLAGLHGRAFIAALPAEVRHQRAVLDAVLDAVERDPRWHTVELVGALARGRGDRLSGIELVLGSDPAADELPVRAARDLLGGLGSVVDMLDHRAADRGDPHRVVAAELGDGVRVEMTLVPADAMAGRRPGAVVLHDPDGRLTRVWSPSIAVHRAAAREWVFLGWWALADVAAGIARGSFPEAVEDMAQVRAAVCRLWAVGEGVDCPEVGLPSLLDDPAARTPKGLEALMPRPLPADLRTAALAAADLLHQAANHAGRRLGAVPRSRLEASVRRRLGARR